MSLLSALYKTTLDAIFPIPEAEQLVLAMGPKSARMSLPRAKNFSIPHACSVFAYKDERVWRLIWAIKYKKSAAGAAIAGYALYEILRGFADVVANNTVDNTFDLCPKIIVVPMPITKKRRRERGFNQCELIADEIEKLDRLNAEKRGEGHNERCDGQNNLIVVRDLLMRIRHKSRQTLKDREERLESAQNIFQVNKDMDSVDKGSLIIIIDDVITTGSTMKDAVETLRLAGFENTFGLSVAH